MTWIGIFMYGGFVVLPVIVIVLLIKAAHRMP